jgi:hypothetical protein
VTAPHPYERLTDRCPECVETLNLPRTVQADGNNARATYRCSECGHGWFCNWSALLIGEAAWTLGGDAA